MHNSPKMQISLSIPKRVCEILLRVVPKREFPCYGEWRDLQRAFSKGDARVYLIHPSAARKWGAPAMAKLRAHIDFWRKYLTSASNHAALTAVERQRLRRRLQRLDEWIGASVIEVLGRLEEA